MVELQRLENIEDLYPKRVKKYLLIWCSSGELSVLVDDKELTLKKYQVLTITSGQYHQIKPKIGANGYVLSFTLDFIAKTEKDIELIFQNSLFCHFDYNEIITINQPIELNYQLNAIEVELSSKPFQYLETIHSRIELVLVMVNRAKINNGGEVWKPNALFLQFLEYVRNHFEENLSAKQIAEKLGTTDLKLNELAKEHTGSTAQNVIHGLVISEAKRVLQYENKIMKEVAFSLGFKDQYYFSKYFKKHTGVSPSEYERNLKTRA